MIEIILIIRFVLQVPLTIPYGRFFVKLHIGESIALRLGLDVY